MSNQCIVLKHSGLTNCNVPLIANVGFLSWHWLCWKPVHGSYKNVWSQVPVYRHNSNKYHMMAIVYKLH